jgi:hypothetical protein
MRLVFLSIFLTAFSTASVAQEWEVGVAAGYSWYHNAGIDNSPNSVRVGYAPRAEIGVVFADNEYKYVAGELQYSLRFGGTELASGGITETAPGYSNTVVYNLVVHLRPVDYKFRPFAAVGSGIRVYTNSQPLIRQPLAGVALLTQGTQVEPAISFDAGIKYLLPHHAQLRLDLRGYTTPAPNVLVHPVGLSRVQGWIWDFAPMIGIGYVY